MVGPMLRVGKCMGPIAHVVVVEVIGQTVAAKN